MAASASAGASGVDFKEISSIKRFGSNDAALEVNKRKILHVNVEDVNALNHDELQEKEMFEQSGPTTKSFIIAMHCVDGDVHRHLETRKDVAKLHFYFEQVLINGLILIATISVLLQTTRQFDPHCTDDKIQSRRSECTGHEWEHFWYYVDHSCFAIFGVEWLFRMCGSFYIGRARLYWRDPMNWIDIISIVPFYLQQILHKQGVDLRFIRAARLARITSSLKTMRFGNMNELIADIVNSSVAALIIPLYFMSLSAIVLGAFMYQVEGGSLYCCEFDVHGHIPDSCVLWLKKPGFDYGDCAAVDEPELQSITLTSDLQEASGGFDSIPAGIWWCFVTFTTVGYGDIIPQTLWGQLLNGLAMFLGVFFFAMPVAIIGDSFVAAWKNKNMKDNASTARRLLISGHWQPDLKRLGRVQQDLHAHARVMKDRISGFRDTRPKVEQDAWDDLSHAVSVFKHDFDTVWGYYNVDVEQLREEMRHKLDELEKLERLGSASSPAASSVGDFKMTNPLHYDGEEGSDSDSSDVDSADGALGPPAQDPTKSPSAAGKLRNPLLTLE